VHQVDVGDYLVVLQAGGVVSGGMAGSFRKNLSTEATGDYRAPWRWLTFLMFYSIDIEALDANVIVKGV
jgi:hypothetical protein